MVLRCGEKMLASNSRMFKSVPFIFWSTEVSESQILRAFDLSIHGLFIKDTTFQDLKNTFTDTPQLLVKEQNAFQKGQRIVLFPKFPCPGLT